MADREVASVAVQKAVVALITEKGVVEAAKALDLARETVSKVAGGVPVRSATLFQVKAKLKIEDDA